MILLLMFSNSEHLVSRGRSSSGVKGILLSAIGKFYCLKMKSHLILLKFAGMLPSVVEGNWKSQEGHLCPRVGKVSLGFLVFSVLSVLLRIIMLLWIYFSDGLLALYTDDTKFDITGNRIIILSFFLCDLFTTLSLLFNHKKIKNWCNKMLFLSNLLGIIPQQMKRRHILPRSLLGNPFLEFIHYLTAFVCLVTAFSVMQSIYFTIVDLALFAFTLFCCSSIRYLTFLQSKVHSLDQLVLGKFQTRKLSDPHHILNVLLYRKAMKLTHLQQSGRGKITRKNRYPMVAIYLRLQEVVDCLVQEFMESVGLTILIQMTCFIVACTMSSYFLIKSLISPVINAYGIVINNCMMSSYVICLALAFTSMSNTLSKEVSFDYHSTYFN